MNWPSISIEKNITCLTLSSLLLKKLLDTTDDMDKVLLAREAFWCAQLCTLQPYGLNKRSEFNSKNRIRFN